ncbi:hypothetical protein CMUS01_09308 [Colletotrichum musicola]|uniref:Uncharacterized protein n=1 Tax=Colletotrichum musicola TaxID=2175873 RepID=A0A8H6K8Z4_9PEZI|nr:hypothetical protein CMUS01_09308 [Colletotrichum musicola]
MAAFSMRICHPRTKSQKTFTRYDLALDADEHSRFNVPFDITADMKAGAFEEAFAGNVGNPIRRCVIGSQGAPEGGPAGNPPNRTTPGAGAAHPRDAESCSAPYLAEGATSPEDPC